MGIGVPLAFMKFSRNFESEADFLGMEYMYKADYDPQSFISFFEKIEARRSETGRNRQGIRFSPDDARPGRACAARDENSAAASR